MLKTVGVSKPKGVKRLAKTG